MFFFQGGLEDGEDFVQAARRETAEEIGIKTENIQLIAQIEPVFYYEAPVNSWLCRKGYKGQAIAFSLFLWDGQLSDCNLDGHLDIPPEFSEVKWIHLSDWSSQLSPFVAPFKRLIFDCLQIKIPHYIDTLKSQ